MLTHLRGIGGNHRITIAGSHLKGVLLRELFFHTFCRTRVYAKPKGTKNVPCDHKGSQGYFI